MQDNGVILSNMHTPLIAHTAEDSLAIYSGLYGDRDGQPVSNTYKTFKPDGTTEAETSFVYWTSPVITNTSTRAPSATDHAPSMVYLVLESSDDIPTVFGSAPDLGGYANAPGRLSYGWSRLVPHRRGARPGPRLLVDLDTG